MDYRIIEVDSRRLVGKFIKFPRAIYRGNNHWVPPLTLDMRRRLHPLENPFFRYGSVKLFAALDEKEALVGRCAAIINPVHDELYHDKAGFFGMFECIDDIAAARALMGAVMDELRGNNRARVIGPVNFTTNDEAGILVEGFDSDPMIMTAYNPPYYAKLLEACGFEKAMDMLNYEWQFSHAYPDRFERIMETLSLHSEIHIRPLNRKRLKEEILAIREVYNASFQGVWGFVPITLAEAEEMGKVFRLFADDELVLFAEYKGKPVGFCLTLPDVNEILKELNGTFFPFGIFRFALRRRRIRNARVMVLGVLPAYRNLGTAAMLIHRLHRVGRARHYQKAELGVVMESNQRMRGLLDTLGFRANKRYRIYHAPINDNIMEVTTP
ncbi:MAG: GNAT family N-acetyltransferase [Candidatus Aminicenantes bacterium]|nr:GNAT family N-acetyltransferase [Candidatus Aminicenantes bacterium]